MVKRSFERSRLYIDCPDSIDKSDRAYDGEEVSCILVGQLERNEVYADSREAINDSVKYSPVLKLLDQPGLYKRIGIVEFYLQRGTHIKGGKTRSVRIV